MKSLYEKIYESLKEEITSGKYKVGEQIPSEKELTKYFSVSTITTKKALEKLSNEGFVNRIRGKGTFVIDYSKNMNDEQKVENEDKPLFGLIMTTFDDSFGNELIGTIEEASQGKCFVILRRSLSIPSKEDKVINELIAHGIDGLIVSPAQAEHYSLEILKMVVNQFPLVLIDRTFKGLAAPSVSTNNEQAAQVGVNHLLELGHKNIGVLIPKANSTTTIEDRKKGILRAFAKKKLIADTDLWCSDIRNLIPSHEDAVKDIEVIKEHIKKHREITALFALEYNIAILAKQAIEQLNLKVPEDISIICFDSPPRNKFEWNFTHIEQNEKEIGRLALNKLFEMYKGDFTVNNIHVPAKLVKGDTTTKLSV
ncbi:LacI family transcriptional regulator [Bacillus sp. J14TS2]|uniref:GntR family transcriptional regulator n=1 Tax=Bacillus sp. J14TS2 TaxID=2807188 RepID=UPI001B21BB6A|nr:GntR family transcriptional regulator [Bacillus sp. J14TS2]GIN71515.1 LacI family transcriptional regulator [Bacillus sp. J14TS2]